ncbi:MAG: CBS domain-containing protein, partial [Chloroflexi bacterium]|nr:CBS domain-containing protein [Chloroflexota bacterium]
MTVQAPLSSASGRPGLLQKANESIRLFFSRHPLPESASILITTVIVGAGAGLGGVILRRLIRFFTTLFFTDLQPFTQSISPFHLMLIPAFGGLVIGPIIYRFAREAKGHGVPEVMEAVALRGGRIRPQVAVVKSLASSICIGTGGAVGQEGAIAQIGSAIGSTIGQVLKLSDERVRNLVACGAAGGIAATFNAPIAGAIFAMEIILGQLHTINFGSVVIASVTADVIARAFEGNFSVFSIPQYTLKSPLELVFYTLLGVLAALGAIVFSRVLYFLEDQWDRFPFPEYLKPMLGGLVLGLIGILTYKVDGFPRVFAGGYDTISEALMGNLAVPVILVLLVAKLLATTTTLASGGSGGIFAPSLFMGAMLGSAFGQTLHLLLPEVTAPTGAYALVGMAAFFSGATHAPITSIIMLFEMTNDYRLILPLMLATVISTLVSRRISADSIYTLKLSRRGIHLQQGQDIDVMQGITVGEAMSRTLNTVSPHLSLPDLVELFSHTHFHSYPVVNEENELLGIVTIQDLDRAIGTGEIKDKTVADIATTTKLLVAYPNEPMWKALNRMGSLNVGVLPVIAEENSKKMVGVIRRTDIIRAYRSAIVKRAQSQYQLDVLRLGKLDKASFVNLKVPQNSPVAGQRISEMGLPPECLVVSVRRGRELHVASGYTILQGGDQLTVFANSECIAPLQDKISGTASDEITTPLARHREIVVGAGANCAGK